LVGRSVGRLVGWLVDWLVTTFYYRHETQPAELRLTHTIQNVCWWSRQTFKLRTGLYHDVVQWHTAHFSAGSSTTP